ncbi:hypothetical protein GBA52_015210 [Prunus armeniaca]|nr:hypothetical protein GBA52_015210 [Prunus armeniaca]
MNSISLSTKPIAKTIEDIGFFYLCEKSLRSLKARRKSIVIPIGTLQFRVCRHRALLFKYLCDRLKPQGCEHVRGYLDFIPHAWNIILINRGSSKIRMVVDACRPLDIREETNLEYYCRYIPPSRTKVSPPIGPTSFPSVSSCGETPKNSVTSLIRLKYGSNEAVGKRSPGKAPAVHNNNWNECKARQKDTNGNTT